MLRSMPRRRSKPSYLSQVVTLFSSLRTLWPAIFVAYSCLLPRELGITIGSADFRLSRIMLLLFAPMLLRLAKARPVHFNFMDLCACFVAAWYVIAMATTSTLSEMLGNGAGQATDFFLAYFVGRICIRTPDDFRNLFMVVVPAFALVGFLIMIESVTHHQFVRATFAHMLGRPEPLSDNQVRWGLMRSMGPFPHPILAGTILASLFPLVLFVSRTWSERGMGYFATFCCLFTVSSTTFLNLFAGIGLSALMIAQRITRWPLAWIAAAYTTLGVVTISLFYNGGLMKFVVQRMTVSSDSGYWRLLIWQYGGAEANSHPWFGIGMRDWERPAWMVTASVDTLWLLLTMQFGYPLIIAFFLLCIGTLSGLILRAKNLARKQDRDVHIALAIFIITMMLSGLSVFLWEGIWVWMIMLIGFSVSLGENAKRIAPRKVLRPRGGLKTGMRNRQNLRRPPVNARRT